MPDSADSLRRMCAEPCSNPCSLTRAPELSAAAIGNGASSGLVLALFFTSMMSCTVGAGRAGYTGGMLV